MAAGGFAAEHPAGRRYQLTAADALRARLLQARRRSAANAGSVMSRADGGGSIHLLTVKVNRPTLTFNTCTL